MKLYMQNIWLIRSKQMWPTLLAENIILLNPGLHIETSYHVLSYHPRRPYRPCPVLFYQAPQMLDQTASMNTKVRQTWERLKSCSRRDMYSKLCQLIPSLLLYPLFLLFIRNISCQLSSQSSRFIFPREEPTREWCLIGDDGLDVESPADFKASSGTRPSCRSSSNLGVYPLSIVVFS